MKKKAKSVELVTAPLTWCDSTRAKWEKVGKKREVRGKVWGVRCLKTDP